MSVGSDDARRRDRERPRARPGEMSLSDGIPDRRARLLVVEGEEVLSCFEHLREPDTADRGSEGPVGLGAAQGTSTGAGSIKAT